MREETFFDSTGTPIAYIDHEDGATVYSFAGKPLAYLDGESIFGFNGKHLGWFEDGVLWNYSGSQAGFIQARSPAFTQFERVK